MTREYKVEECVYCKKTRYIAAKGLCRACYSRVQKYGRVEKVRKRTKCKVEDCDRHVKSGGYCSLHWHRVKVTGDPHKTLRTADWGKREAHPLYHSWQWLKQHSGVVDRWLKFWDFVADVGERPSESHRLNRINEAKPYGPENFFWKEKEFSANEHAMYARKHRERNPDSWKNADLKKSFGITLKEYNAMLEKQNGKCAFCGNEERFLDRRIGKVRALAVDHCHTTGKVRGLLCQSCNRALGAFADNPLALERAALYLRAHAKDRNALPT